MANSILLSETLHLKIYIFFQSTVESSGVHGYRELPRVCTGVYRYTYPCRYVQVCIGVHGHKRHKDVSKYT